jgi:hypothetical protein
MILYASAVASDNDHGYEAGRYVANQVLAAFQQPPALLIACISNRYNNPAEVVRGIRSINNTIPLIGSSGDGVITLAGVLQKGVGLLAFHAHALQCHLASAGGLQQPAQAAERAIEHLTSSTPQEHHTTLLLLVAGAAEALQQAGAAAAARMGSGSTLVGGAAGSVFVDDEEVSDGLAAGLLHTAAPVGVGVAQSAEEAAQQAMAALGGRAAAAAIIVDSRTRSSAAEGEAAADVARIREIIGRTVPLVGMYGAGVAGNATSRSDSILVAVHSQEQHSDSHAGTS